MRISSPVHSYALHFLTPWRVLDVRLENLLLPRMGIVLRRHRSDDLPPRATEHGDKLSYFLSLQFRSQEPVSHALDSWAVLHDMPPFFGLVRMLRVRPRYRLRLPCCI